MRLTKNTLFNISRHTNKTIKIADYLSKGGHPLLFSKMAMVNEDSSDVAFIEAFNKDLADTTKKIEDVHQLLSTVDDNGNVIHLKGEQSLKNIFGDDYDLSKQTIKLPFGELELRKEFNRDAIKADMLSSYLGITTAEYNVLFKARKKIFKHSKDQLFTDEEKIEFLSTVTDREKYDGYVSLIKKMSKDYTVFRKQLTLEERSLVDDQITFQRSMVDSITKDSTYITKKEGIVQTSPTHKRENESIKRIIEELNNNKYIDSVEIDKDTDLNAFLNLMQQSSEIKFNLKEAVSLKCRKLGNYNANGLFYSQSNIVAVDVKSPSAAVHEFVHAVDLKNDNIKYSQKRRRFASKMRSYLNLAGFSPKDRLYYNSTAEIIARAGEISFLFEEHNFNPEKESVQEFAVRVSEHQDKSNPYDLNLVKNINYYLENPSIYFDLGKMKNEDLLLMKDYYKSYFRIKEELKIEELKNVAVPEHQEHKVIGQRTRYVATSVGLINKDNIASLLDYNEEHKIIETNKLIEEIMFNPLKLNRTQKNITNAELTSKKEIFVKLCEWAEERDDLYIISRIAEARVKVDPNIKKAPYFLADRLINNPQEIKDDIFEHMDEYIEEGSKAIEGYYSMSYNSETQEKRKQMTEKYQEVLKSTIAIPQKRLDEYLNENPLMKKLEEVEKAAVAIENAKNERVLTSYMGSLYKPVDTMMQNAYNKHGKDIFNYFSQKDLLPIALMAQSNSANKSQILSRNFQSYILLTKPENTITPYYSSPELFSVVDKLGHLKPIIKNMDMVNVNTNPSILIKAKRNISTPEFISRSKAQSFANIAVSDVEINAYKTILKEAMGKNIQEAGELTYEHAKSICTVDFPDYEKVQSEIQERINSFSGLNEEDLNTVVENIVDEKIESPKLASEPVPNSLITEKTDNELDKTPIDPNEKLEETNKRKLAKQNPNQFKLF